MSYFDYSDGETKFQGYWASNGDDTSKRPCVLVGHAWSGPDAYFNKLAEEIAKRGFIAFAIDVYGKGVRGEVDGDNSHLMNPLLENRALLRRRLLAAFRVAQQHALVIPEKIAMIGHCFGGLCALDLARANPPGLRGAVSVHGLLNGPGFTPRSQVEASVLVLHGWEDPMVTPANVLEFASEMTELKADWQIHNYGHAMHAFTFVGADFPQLGIRYNKKAHWRSEQSIYTFLNEVFSD